MSFYRGLFVVACLWLLAVLVPKLNSPWVWDDQGTVAYRPQLRDPEALSSLLSPRYFDVSGELSWRPASTLLYIIGLKVFGSEPVGHRALELALHLLAAMLFVACLKRWGLAESACWLAGALFVIHPLHLETLFCVSFNKEILVALGLLTAWYGRLRRADGGGPAWSWLSLAGFVLALLSKETALLILPLLWLLDLARPGGRSDPWSGWTRYVFAAAGYAGVRFMLLRGAGEAAGFPVWPPLPMRVYFAGRGLAQFFGESLLPVTLRLEYFALPPAGLRDYAVCAGGWLTAAGLLFAAWRLRKRRPAFAAGSVWALLLLFPTLNLIPAYALTTRWFADRWSYVPLLGFSLAAAAALAPYLERRPARVAVLGFAAWLAACGFVSSKPWARETLLWSNLAAAYPWSAKAHEGLGQADFRAGLYQEALDQFQAGEALRQGRSDRLLSYYVPLFESRAAGRMPPLHWENPASWRWQGRAWQALGRTEQAEACFRRAATESQAFGL